MMKAGLLAVAAVALATPALANTTSDNSNTDPFTASSATLRLDGLNLATVDGQNRLAIRMDAAARAVCGEGLDTVHLQAAAEARACRTRVHAQIRDQIETRLAAARSEDAAPVQLALNR
tara:strand:- start:1651 stop:2007 length:357 start_codon:yes stop_codon:yes gene_type:complete